MDCRFIKRVDILKKRLKKRVINMRIGIDARLWNETGVGRYIRNLVWQLQVIDTKNEYVLFVQNEFNEQEFGIRKSDKWQVVKTDIRWHTIDEQFVFHKVLENELLDLVHFPYFSIPILYNRPFVMTIHDLIIDHFPTGKASTLPLPLYYAKRFGYKYILKQAAKKAKKVISVSEATKMEIIDHLGITGNKIEVTYEGVDERIAKSSNKTKRVPTKLYFLYVGNAYPHKNVERLIDAFQLIFEQYDDVQLVMVGKENYFYKRIIEKVNTLGLQENVLFVGAVNDSALSDLYHDAEALMYPSLMEGFGLPGLEAMQQECLVLASDIPVFREIYKDAVVYFDPRDVSSMRDTIQKVLEDEAFYREKIQRGKHLVQSFSWEKMAKQTLHIYESSVSL
jgi:glycosyltransferase involved in cell wall biosynthesis